MDHLLSTEKENQGISSEALSKTKNQEILVLAADRSSHPVSMERSMGRHRTHVPWKLNAIVLSEIEAGIDSSMSV
jgi:hypothetical protein